MWSEENVNLVMTKIDHKCQLLADWGPGRPIKHCLIVLDPVIVYLSALMKNCLVRSHKGLRPANILVPGVNLAVENGFPLLPGISLELMEEKRFIAPEVLKYQQTWNDPSSDTDSSCDDDSSTDCDALPDAGSRPNRRNPESWTHSCRKADVFSFGQLVVLLLGGDVDMIERPLVETLPDGARARELVTLLRKCCVENKPQQSRDLTELVTRWCKISS
jgi:hypothetical protein